MCLFILGLHLGLKPTEWSFSQRSCYMSINVKKTKVNSDTEVLQGAICLPDRDTKNCRTGLFKSGKQRLCTRS